MKYLRRVYLEPEMRAPEERVELMAQTMQQALPTLVQALRDHPGGLLVRYYEYPPADWQELLELERDPAGWVYSVVRFTPVVEVPHG